MSRITPEFIQNMGPNEIFVFGSNLAGHHAGGAARVAHMQMGAQWGQGVGLHGQSYALPTMDLHMEPLSVEGIKMHVDDLLKVVKQRTDLQFYITKVGCGIAGFSVDEIEPLFAEFKSLENCYLPIEFI